MSVTFETGLSQREEGCRIVTGTIVINQNKKCPVSKFFPKFDMIIRPVSIASQP